jgi:phosphoglycerate dehydrogenase-like enzyme
MKAAADHNVLVCGTDASGFATAELTMGLMLSLARQIPFEAQAMRQGGWQTTIGIDLRGRTLGIISLGRLGGQVAQFAAAFGMLVVAWSANLTHERAIDAGASRVDKDELLACSDFITIHTKLSQRTRGLIGAREIALMKPTAYLINTSRGPIVDETALVAALEQGRIAGCALDVYDVEPLSINHPLRKNRRALLTPHLGYVTLDTYRVFYRGTVAAIENWLAGRPSNVLI